MSNLDKLDAIKERVHPVDASGQRARDDELRNLFLHWLVWRTTYAFRVHGVSMPGITLYADLTEAIVRPLPSGHVISHTGLRRSRPRAAPKAPSYQSECEMLAAWRKLEERVEVQVVLDILLARWREFMELVESGEEIPTFETHPFPPLPEPEPPPKLEPVAPAPVLATQTVKVDPKPVPAPPAKPADLQDIIEETAKRRRSWEPSTDEERFYRQRDRIW
jgi:hypothetical protein